jgi:hypothetical protein
MSEIGLWPNKKNSKKVQLRTAKELAEEFGITAQQLSGYLTSHKGPKHVVRPSPSRAYFDAVQVRAWWTEIKK